MEKGRTLGKLLIGCLGCTALLIGPSLTKHTNVRDGVQFSSSKKQNMGHQTSLGLGVEVRGEGRGVVLHFFYIVSALASEAQ